MKYLCLAVLMFILLFNSQVLAQEEWAVIDTRHEIDFLTPKGVIPVLNKKTGNLSVLVKHRKISKLFLIDENQNIVSEFKTDTYTNKATNYIGGIALDNNYTHFFKNKSNSVFEALTVNYNTKKVNVQLLDIELKKDYIIETFEDDNYVYILSIARNSSILKIHKLNCTGVITKTLIDLSKESFKKFNGLETSLYYLITNNQHPSKLQSSSISYNVPNSIEKTSSVNKIYFKDGIITITNDNISSHTNIISIDIDNGDYKYYQVPKKGFLKKELRSESNSFILDNLYFSLYTTTDKLVFSVYNLSTKSFLKELVVKDSDSINFKNTPVIEAKGRRVKKKGGSSSNQFLRHLTNSNVGLSAYKKDNFIVVSLGGSEKEQSMTLAVVGGVFAGAVGAMLLSAFDSYTKTNSTRIDCLFNEDLDHIKGEVPINGFEMIKDYVGENNLHNAPLQTVLKVENNFIWGYYNRSTGAYKFLKFKD